MNATAVVEQAKPNDYFRFVADVNTILLETAGVSYAEVVRSIHPGSDAPKHAFDGGVAPAAFVAGIIADERFMELGGDLSDEAVRGHNIAMAAIAEFVFETDDWHRSGDGRYFSHCEENTLTIRPVSDENGRYGFGVEVWSGTSSSPDVAVTDDMGEPIARFAGHDITAPVNVATEHLESASHLRY
jgi:hypothetical protein